jgi:hypothetical protein
VCHGDDSVRPVFRPVVPIGRTGWRPTPILT